MTEAVRDDRVVAALGERTYPFALVLGAASGVLVERLSRRCGRLFVLRSPPVAVDAPPNVVVRAADDLPDWTFDLVVCVDAVVGAPAGLLDRLEARMPRAGTLIAVTAPSQGCPDAHAALRARPGLVRVHADADADLVVERYERRAGA